MDEELDDFLAHYGVKGMKWGVRRAKKKQGTIDSLRRVSKGKGNFEDEATAITKVSGIDLIRGRGVKGAAGIKADRMQRRLDTGQARNAERKKIVAELGKTYNLKTSSGKKYVGAAAATTLLASPVANVVAGAQLTRASGYSKGTSVAVGLVSGTAGGLAVAELTARSRAKKR